MKGKKYNPIIGYLVIDKNNQVMGPPGEEKDVAYQSEARAKEAAVEYGYEAEVGQIAALHLEGVLGVVKGGGGDIYLDGPAATALVKGCQKRGIRVKRAARKGIRRQEMETVYSSRALLWDEPGEES